MILLTQLRERRIIRKSVARNVEVGAGFSVGARSRVWAPVRLRIGAGVALGSDVRIEVDGEIGDAVLIANRVGIVGRSDHRVDEIGVSVRDAAWVGHSPERLSRPISIGSDVWIGYAATILSGVTVGDSAIVGAGAVVVHDVPANSVVVGNPARIVAHRFTEAGFNEHWDKLSQRGLRRTSLDNGS